MKNTRTFLFLGIFCLFFVTSQAAPVNPDQALKAAIGFYFQRVNQVKAVPAKDIRVTETREFKRDGRVLYYAMNFENGGWVLVSGDDRLIPVIGYSFEGTYGSKTDPCCHEYWMKGVEKNISSALDENVPASAEATKRWSELLNTETAGLPVVKSKAVTPLLQSTWGQGSYYNALCPAATGGPDDRALVGCVATSMSQVMYYYRWPLQGNGSHGGVNFSSYYYRWNEMMNSVVAPNQGAAEICYHAGVSVDMDYGADGSGSFTWLVPEALKNHFRYSTDCSYENEYSYSTSGWANLLIGNLDALHPVIYSGQDPSNGGHAWVCDGYQGTDYFHMNWGWDGAYDGYFYLNNLSAGGANFSEDHGAVVDIYPPAASYPASCSGTTTVPYTRGSIADGSGPSNYANNANCQWLIDPDETIAKITIQFYAFATEATNDVVTIYDGNSTSAPVLGTYSGSSLPSTVVTTGDKALVVFTSNGSTTNTGWYLEYRSSYPVYCSGIVNLTSATGTIEDGSGTLDYSYNQVCRWNVQPPNAESITVNFTDLDVASDDWIKIYDLNTSAELASYTGSTLPAQLVCNTSKILVFFKTNDANNAGGWALNYTASVAGLREDPDFGSFSIYPNPTRDKVTLDFTPVSGQNFSVDIMTLDGRILMHRAFEGVSGPLHTDLDVAGLSQGMYLFRISGASGNLTTKLVVE